MQRSSAANRWLLVDVSAVLSPSFCVIQTKKIYSFILYIITINKVKFETNAVKFYTLTPVPHYTNL